MCLQTVALILRDGATVMSRSESTMKFHPHDPEQLAHELKDELEGVTPAEILGDMRAHPDLYFPDHTAACKRDGTLPLSRVAWRRACRST